MCNEVACRRRAPQAGFSGLCDCGIQHDQRRLAPSLPVETNRGYELSVWQKNRRIAPISSY